MTRYALTLVSLLLSPTERLSDRTYTLRGEGYLDPAGPGSRVPVREVRLRLHGGTFIATVDARGERIDVRGRWQARGKSQVERLEIEDAFGQRADGNGALHFKGRGDDRPVRLHLEGRTRHGGFRLVMDCDGERNRDWDDVDLGRGDRWRRGLDLTTSGEGLLRMFGVRDGRFTVMRARLSQSREAVISIDRPTRGTVRGEIARVDRNRVVMRVREIMGSDTSGELEFVLRTEDELTSAHGYGTSRQGSWQLDFDGPASRGGRGDVWDVGGWGRDRLPFPSRASREASARGSGTLNQDVGPTLTFDQARVSLSPDGSATLVLDGRSTVGVQGSWSERDYGATRIDVRQVNEMPARGQVELRFSRGVVEEVTGEGRTALGRFALHFRAR
jgi:hypothetical protein